MCIRDRGGDVREVYGQERAGVGEAADAARDRIRDSVGRAREEIRDAIRDVDAFEEAFATID